MQDEYGRIFECPNCNSQRIIPIGKERNCFIYICHSCRFTSHSLGFRAVPKESIPKVKEVNPSRRDSYE